jgi:Sec-independent protein secretion pathway component TatC
MALPLILLYEIGILGARLWGKSRDPLNAADEAQAKT